MLVISGFKQIEDAVGDVEAEVRCGEIRSGAAYR